MKKKRIYVLLAFCMLLGTIVLSGCVGNDGTKEKSPYEGKWVAILAEMMDIQVSVDEAFGGEFYFVVKNGGKADVTVGEDSSGGKWVVDGDQFTLTIEGRDMVGAIGKDSIIFDDMMDMGVKVIFAKEGTDAMNPALYMTEEEKAMIGEWTAESVEEIMGDGPQTTMEGVENISDALRMDFKEDHKVSVVYKGQKVGDFTWSAALGSCLIESEEPGIYITTQEDGKLSVAYSNEDDYFTFICVKAK